MTIPVVVGTDCPNFGHLTAVMQIPCFLKWCPKIGSFWILLVVFNITLFVYLKRKLLQDTLNKTYKWKSDTLISPMDIVWGPAVPNSQTKLFDGSKFKTSNGPPNVSSIFRINHQCFWAQFWPYPLMARTPIYFLSILGTPNHPF